MNPIPAARVIVFAFIVVVAFVDRRRLVWVADPYARLAILSTIGLLTALDLPLALLVSVGYLLAEVFYRTHDVKRDALRAASFHRCQDEFDELRYGRRRRGSDDGTGEKMWPAAPSVPFLTEENLRAAAEDNVVPGARLSDGIRFGQGWLSPQGLGEAIEPA